MDQVVIATWTQCPELYAQSSAMIDLPYPKVSLRAFQYERCIVDLLALDSEWIVHIDEDAFVYDTSRIPLLIDHMKQNSYVCAGVPDGGLHWMRVHNPICCNPHFLILHRPSLLKLLAEDPDVIDCPWDHSYAADLPNVVRRRDSPYLFDRYEPYYGFFFWLRKHRMPILYLDAEIYEHEAERTSTVVKDHTETSFLIHSWYAREYWRRRSNPKEIIKQCLQDLMRWVKWQPQGAHYERISRVIEMAKGLRIARTETESKLQ